jgi:hypothetical protein
VFEAITAFLIPHCFERRNSHCPCNGRLPTLHLATFRRKIEALGCCRRIAQGLENCKVGQI